MNANVHTHIGEQIDALERLLDVAFKETEALRRDVHRAKYALEIIAGKRQCVDNLLSNVEVAEWALRDFETP